MLTLKPAWLVAVVLFTCPFLSFYPILGKRYSSAVRRLSQRLSDHRAKKAVYPFDAWRDEGASEENGERSSMLIRLTANGLQKIAEKAGAEMLRYIQTVKMGDIGVPLDGGRLNITDVKVQGMYAKFFQYPQPSESIVWGFNNGRATVLGKWFYAEEPTRTVARKWPVQGSFRAFITNTIANLTYSLRRSKVGFVEPHNLECNLCEGSVKFFADGSTTFSQEYNVVVDSSKVLPNYANLICAASKIYIMEAYNRMSSKYKTIQPFGTLSKLLLNASVVDDPKIDQKHVDIPLNGLVFARHSASSSSVDLQGDQCSPTTSKCLYFSIATLNSLFAQGYKSQIFKTFFITLEINGVEVTLGVSLTAPPVIPPSDIGKCYLEGAVYSTDSVPEAGGAVFNATSNVVLKTVANSRWLISLGSIGVKVATVGAWPGLSDVTILSTVATKGLQEITGAFLQSYQLPIPQLDSFKWLYSNPAPFSNAYLSTSTLVATGLL